MATGSKQKAMLAVGGVGLLAFLMMGKKAKAAGTTTGGEVGAGAPPTDEEGKGGIGEPAGPNGCKTGLKVNKEGICVKEDTGTGTGNGGTLKPSEIYISNKCDTFKFGDKTGESWWKNSGKKKASDWLKSGYTNLTLIAFEMIRKNKEICFKDFPVQDKFESNFDLQGARIDWIIKYPMMWALLHAIRNFIDRDLLEGLTYVKLNISGTPWKYEFGKKFDFESFWADVEPLAYYIVYKEQEKPGSMLDKLGIKYPGYKDDGSVNVNTVIALYSIIFPYVVDKKLWEKNMINLTTGKFYGTLWDKVDALTGQSLEYEFEVP